MAEDDPEAGSDSGPICPLCRRPIPPDAPQSRHHLVPKLKGGKGGPTVLLHQICHAEIHATLTEAELSHVEWAARQVAPLVKPWDWPIARRGRAQALVS